MRFRVRVLVSLLAVVAFAAEAADVTGQWTATIATAAGQEQRTFVFRQSGPDLIGTSRSENGVVALSDGSVNNKTITFVENVTVQGRRVVLEYTGELVSDTEIRFKRQIAGAANPVTQFVATRSATR